MVAMEKNPYIKEAIAIMGGVVEAARVLNLRNYQTVQSWMRQGVVPVKYCVAVQVATDGRVAVKSLRPDDWRSYWPDVETQQVAGHMIPVSTTAEAVLSV